MLYRTTLAKRTSGYRRLSVPDLLQVCMEPVASYNAKLLCDVMQIPFFLQNCNSFSRKLFSIFYAISVSFCLLVNTGLNMANSYLLKQILT